MEIWNFLVELMEESLKFFYEISGNYGIAIILLTVLIKIITYPLTQKQFKAMKDLQKLAPLMKELQEKHKKNPKEVQKRMMALYKEHKINPLGGCLPLIIQMPILIMLYQTILNFKNDFISFTFLWTSNSDKMVLFSDTSFLWIPSLLTPDMILLILYAFSMYLSQKLTIIPSPDPSQTQLQNTMAIIMPIMFTIMFKTFPSAFILYWLVFNILSTVHQLIITYPLIKEGRAKMKEKK